MKNKRNTILYFRFFLLVFFISAGTTIPAQGQENDILLNKGVEAYNANRYDEAIEYLRPSAQNGNPISQFFLGNCYFNGNGVKKSYNEAAKWFYKSALQGVTYAQTLLATLYENGLGVEKDTDEALKLYTWAQNGGKPTPENTSLKPLRLKTDKGKSDNTADILTDLGQTMISIAGNTPESNSSQAETENRSTKQTKNHSTRKNKEKEMQNKKFLAAYQNANKAYNGWEDQLRDMKLNPEKYAHLSDDQFCQKVSDIQNKMKKIRIKITNEYDTQQRKSNLEDWTPARCR